MACLILSPSDVNWKEETKDAYRNDDEGLFQSAKLAPLLKTYAVPYAMLANEKFTEGLLGGSTRSCDTIMAIWPAVLETRNLLITIMSENGCSPALQSLAQLTSACQTCCQYTQVHFAIQALRRGVHFDKVKSILSGIRDESNLSKSERAVMNAGQRANFVQNSNQNDIPSLNVACGSAQIARSVALSICCEGYMSKFCQSIGIELEIEAYETIREFFPSQYFSPPSNYLENSTNETSTQSWWLSRLATTWRVSSSAKRYFVNKTATIPNNDFDSLSNHLQARLGHSFPVLGNLPRKSRAALSVALLDALDKPGLDVETKLLACCIFARHHRCLSLERAFSTVARHFGISTAIARSLADGPILESISSLGASARAAMHRQRINTKSLYYLFLARAIAPTPVQIPANLLSGLRDAIFDPRAIVDLVGLMSLCETFKRIHYFFDQQEPLGISRLASYSSASSEESDLDVSIDDTSWQIPRYDNAPLIEDEEEE
mmetsp:Transcript_17968/g.23409  ORF Transcript_17968/g.23409 Transcript_17968/m.23409 type:complete len:491 (+) Transcript_17968:87-1559(+)|eukprot:CAMPEP_0197294222 /NCGR_PEP_ID=MMETSP0890-20130614/31580_1 /TAXON_ID=44058 ORGANISM="Aureoumbra lagunensis, Strain CCMP1510" /NCGR_SAMPLE_ID=MMETSP0890 /ASSEMBLY_ACC=CAM_ASM_000533 /LENGTH=490 /DNA_ID=CAMNT_0042769497 /DNA_START=6 /DNA_END=1478 /DNA_ORIENTATION=+